MLSHQLAQKTPDHCKQQSIARGFHAATPAIGVSAGFLLE